MQDILQAAVIPWKSGLVGTHESEVRREVKITGGQGSSSWHIPQRREEWNRTPLEDTIGPRGGAAIEYMAEAQVARDYTDASRDKVTCHKTELQHLGEHGN